MKRVRKQIGDRILEEEAKNDEQSKRRSGVKTSMKAILRILATKHQ
jgi:hypothetical protein